MKILLGTLAVAALIASTTQPASAFVIGDGGPLCAFMSIDCPPDAPAAAPAPTKHVAHHHKHKMHPKA